MHDQDSLIKELQKWLRWHDVTLKDIIYTVLSLTLLIVVSGWLSSMIIYGV
jgi:hypothetical protein